MTVDPNRDFTVPDDDPEMARFFAGEDLSPAVPVPDGGKDLTPEADDDA